MSGTSGARRSGISGILSGLLVGRGVGSRTQKRVGAGTLVWIGAEAAVLRMPHHEAANEIPESGTAGGDGIGEIRKAHGGLVRTMLAAAGRTPTRSDSRV